MHTIHSQIGVPRSVTALSGPTTPGDPRTHPCSRSRPAVSRSTRRPSPRTWLTSSPNGTATRTKARAKSVTRRP